MKKKSFILAALSVLTLVGMVLIVACKKDNAVQNNHPGVAGTLAACSCSVTASSDSTLNFGVLNTNLTLSANKRYTLAGMVYVVGNHTLTIQAGTQILGRKSNTPGVAGGGLVITKGSQLIANGTSSCPIVFTSAEASPKSGDWGGIILLGRAPINADSTTTNIEGINAASAPAGADVHYGGNRLHESSGSLKFVRIEYAGFQLSLNNAMNSLTLGGVGDGTTIDYVEAYKSNADSFGWFGGTVNVTHVLSVDAIDDMFDATQGYTGTVRYALGLGDTSRADQSQSNGIECENDASGSALRPITHPHYSLVTIIGVPANRDTVHYPSTGAGLAPGTYGRATHLRRNSEFSIDSSLFLGYAEGVDVDYVLPAPGTVNSLTKYQSGISTTNHVWSYGYSFSAASESAGGFTFMTLLGTANAQPTTITGMGYASSAVPFNRSSISNFRPANPFLAARNFGAFPDATDWTIVDGCANWIRLQ